MPAFTVRTRAASFCGTRALVPRSLALLLGPGYSSQQRRYSHRPSAVAPIQSTRQPCSCCNAFYLYCTAATIAVGMLTSAPCAVRANAQRSPLEVLREENQLLKETIANAESDTASLESQLGADVTVASPLPGSEGQTAEDFWTPEVAAVPGGLNEAPLPPMKSVPEHDGTPCLKWDDTLWSHADHFRYRWNIYNNIRAHIDNAEGGMDKFTQAYKHFGINRGEHEGQKGVWYREWAPGAQAIALVGEFNNWEPADGHWALKDEFGNFNLFIPDTAPGVSAIPHRSKVKSRVQLADGSWAERIPAWIKWATQEWNEIQYNGVYYEPMEDSEPGVFEADKNYVFKYPRPQRPRSMRIYECHVGMSTEEQKVNSYMEFRADMIPRIRKLGYNTIQIMAIQEHAYYGSFGYHVTNFFAPSSRCGSPDELKALIDEAHKYGLYVLCDIVHSHASKNENDGISNWDGTDHGFFHSGARGYHWMWDSRCFNYSNWETLRFLMSNTRYWLDEFKFDGFRFDGVTSMMYHHHGLQMAFTGNYDEYFGMSTDTDACVYLMLMNSMVHDMFPHAITIGEDVSGMPAFCRPVEEGGIGFDYRLQMAIADMWIDVMKLHDDFAWGMGHIVHTLTNRRYAEACVGYAESHDQALVGDKTIAFWLMDADMYDKMAAPGFGESSMVVERGVALHKMIRLLTMSLGGESYLTFMGNEFGHPEWIDFPRDDSYDPSTGGLVPGNGGSFEKCRRLWSLSTAEYLRYRYMNDYDRAMMHLDKAFGFVAAPHQYVSKKDEGDKLIVVERGDLVLVFNFHPTQSYTDYQVGCYHPGPYKVALSSDEEVFGGYQNVTKNSDVEFAATCGEADGRPHSFKVYAPCRTVVAYAPSEFCDKDAEHDEYGVPGLAVRGLGPYFEL